MRKPFKIVGWVVVTIVALIIAGVVVQNMYDNKALQVSQAQLEEADQGVKIQNRLNADKVESVRLYLGDVEADELDVCYGAGYPHNRGTYNDLSRREVAKCDAILKRVAKLEARDAAEKARKDAAYDKAHPLKK